MFTATLLATVLNFFAPSTASVDATVTAAPVTVLIDDQVEM
ncbi:hypothetical protein EDC28_102273 [Gallaecimonas pentaromativorans]|uniref:Uncharacterized protein n=1 Tax=Gallaecimonas pentaromativorans TaxID=584787 RepID=A0A3N1PPI3_9GAMM|nr:hypothetical protein EDC28_102273 [Gallaecimonas pentaromativorans]